MPTSRASRRERGQVERERARHRASALSARAPAGDELGAGGHGGGDAREQRLAGGIRRRTIRSMRRQAPGRPASSCAVAMSVTSRLSRARALQRVGAARGCPPMLEPVPPAADADGRAVSPGRSPSCARPAPREQRRARPGHELGEQGRWRRGRATAPAAARYGAERRLGEGIDAEQVKRPARTHRARRRRRSTTGAARARRARRRARVDARRAARRAADDLVGGAAGHRLGGAARTRAGRCRWRGRCTTTTATPRAMPRIDSPSCQGWRRGGARLARQRMALIAAAPLDELAVDCSVRTRSADADDLVGCG